MVYAGHQHAIFGAQDLIEGLPKIDALKIMVDDGMHASYARCLKGQLFVHRSSTVEFWAGDTMLRKITNI